ncbi:lysine transporter [Marinomonas agarivorans]|nr:lysine transporter [Marinomonas agarivorans]
MSSAFLSGFITGGGLIIAVGAQNTFLLEQALKRHFALLIAVLFILSDTLAITMGASGMAALIHQHPIVLDVSRYAGVAFLLYFAFSRFKASFSDEALLLSANHQAPFVATIITGIAVTWLNPHFYLDTMILMGALANQWQSNLYDFVIGGVAASILWFLGLVLLGRILAPYFKEAKFWRWFNRINGCLITIIAINIMLMPLH